MPALGETYGDADEEATGFVGLGLGYGLVVGGGLVLAGGLLSVVGDAASALGAPAPVASRLGLTLALLVVPLALVGLRTRLPRDAGGLPLAAGGGLVGMAVVGSWAVPVGTGTGAGGLAGLSLPLLLAYGLGVALLSAGVLAGPVAARTESGRATGASSSIGFRRTSGAPGSGASKPGITPADGGREAEADLEFPLDEE